MPEPITVESIADIALSTLRYKKRRKLTDIAQSLTSYTAHGSLMKKGKVAARHGRGYAFKFNTAYNTAENVGLYGVDTPNRTDKLTEGEVGWRHTTNNFPWDMRESQINSGDMEQIIDMLDNEEDATYAGMIEKCEANFWGKPADSDDVVTPYGVGYWLTPGAAGFNGGAASGFTTKGGVNPTTYPGIKNYTDNYAAVTNEDLVLKIRRAIEETNFEAMPGFPHLDAGTPDHAIYCNLNTKFALEDILKLNNDNLGMDLDPTGDKSTFRRRAVVRVPYLDSQAFNADKNPVYGINWTTWHMAFLKGWFFKRSIMPAANQHTVKVFHLDLTHNYACINPRKNWLIQNA